MFSPTSDTSEPTPPPLRQAGVYRVLALLGRPLPFPSCHPSLFRIFPPSRVSLRSTRKGAGEFKSKGLSPPPSLDYSLLPLPLTLLYLDIRPLYSPFFHSPIYFSNEGFFERAFCMIPPNFLLSSLSTLSIFRWVFFFFYPSLSAFRFSFAVLSLPQAELSPFFLLSDTSRVREHLPPFISYSLRPLVYS